MSQPANFNLVTLLSHYKKIRPLVVQHGLRILLQRQDFLMIEELFRLYKDEISVAILN